MADDATPNENAGGAPPPVEGTEDFTDEPDRPIKIPAVGELIQETEDFTDDPDRPINAPAVGALAQKREETRGHLAKMLILILMFSTAAAFILVCFDNTPHLDRTDVIVKAVYPPLVALIGTVLGFYFGGER